MKHTLVWRAADIAKLVKITMDAKEWRMEWGNEEAPRPQIILVKDEGIYFVSNKIYPEGKTPSSEGEVFYADGYNPNEITDASKLWDLTHEVSGDDFGYYLDTHRMAEVFNSMSERALELRDFIVSMEFDLEGKDGDLEVEIGYKTKLRRNARL